MHYLFSSYLNMITLSFFLRHKNERRIDERDKKAILKRSIHSIAVVFFLRLSSLLHIS